MYRKPIFQEYQIKGKKKSKVTSVFRKYPLDFKNKMRQADFYSVKKSFSITIFYRESVLFVDIYNQRKL